MIKQIKQYLIRNWMIHFGVSTGTLIAYYPPMNVELSSCIETFIIFNIGWLIYGIGKMVSEGKKMSPKQAVNRAEKREERKVIAVANKLLEALEDLIVYDIAELVKVGAGDELTSGDSITYLMKEIAKRELNKKDLKIYKLNTAKIYDLIMQVFRSDGWIVTAEKDLNLTFKVKVQEDGSIW